MFLKNIMCVSNFHIDQNISNQKKSSIRYWNYGDWSLYWSCSCHCSRLICNLLSSIWWCHIQRRKKITKQILKNNNKFLTTFDACNFVRYFWLFLIKSYRCECLSWNIFRRKLFHKIFETAYIYLFSATIQFGFHATSSIDIQTWAHFRKTKLFWEVLLS